jgi:hypothetical protein
MTAVIAAAALALIALMASEIATLRRRLAAATARSMVAAAELARLHAQLGEIDTGLAAAHRLAAGDLPHRDPTPTDVAGRAPLTAAEMAAFDDLTRRPTQEKP